MLRRPSPGALALGAGVLALLIGLFALRGVIAAEREDALAAVALRQEAAADYAVRELTVELRRRAAGARQLIDQALADPLKPCPGCFRSQAGTQILPRVRVSPPPGTPSIRSHHEEIVAGRGPASDGDATWQRRARLHATCRADPERAVAAIIDHRSRYALPVEQELGSALALLDSCPVPCRPASE